LSPQKEKLDVFDCVVVGAGYSGLAAALRLSQSGLTVKILESGEDIGGLAGTFEFSDGVRVERFYHHWFRSDTYILQLIDELGLGSSLMWVPSRTGSFLNKQIWKLSTPLDLLRFTELSLIDRVRLGLGVLYARTIRDHRKIESKTIREWLEPVVGRKAFDVVWAPLLSHKFGSWGESVSAAWMWKKLILRGGSRQRGGRELLAYFKGGFSEVSRAIREALEAEGASLSLGHEAKKVSRTPEGLVEIQTNHGVVRAHSAVLATPQPVSEKLIATATDMDAADRGDDDIPHLANVCLVLRLNHSLSDTYWLNVNDPGFPFVGVIEHTNLDDSNAYADSHIVYLSRYLDVEDPVWEYSDQDFYDYCLPHIQRMFPDFGAQWILDWRVWRARYAQPVTTVNYSHRQPGHHTDVDNVFTVNMAQIYPEDRGTNYAVRGGFEVAELVKRRLG